MPDQIADIPIFATVKIVLFVPEVKPFTLPSKVMVSLVISPIALPPFSSIVTTSAVDASSVGAKVSGVFTVRLLAVVLLKPCSSVTLRVTVCAEPV